MNNTAIMEDITLHAGWEFDPNAPGFHPLTVTGGIVTVKNGDKGVTNTLTVTTDETTGKKDLLCTGRRNSDRDAGQDPDP